LKLIGKEPRGALFILLALALGCVIAACGSASSSSSTTSSSASSGSSGSSGTTTTAATGSARRTALAACLKQHGVTLPSRPAGAAPGGASGGAPGSGTGTGTGTTGTGTTPRRGFFGGGGGFANNPKLQAAFKACGANFGFRRGNFAGRLSHTAVTKYVTCVRQHGYNLPNPNFSGKGPIFAANIRTNQKFIAASKPCQSLLIPPRPSGSGGTSTTSGA
jgi:hypothetical protein